MSTLAVLLTVLSFCLLILSPFLGHVLGTYLFYQGEKKPKHFLTKDYQGRVPSAQEWYEERLQP